MYYVVCSNSYGVVINVHSFNTRQEAFDYAINLDEEYYMVTIRNDNLLHNAIFNN